MNLNDLLHIMVEKKASDNEKIKEEHLVKLEKLKIEEEKLDAIFKEQEEALSKITKLSKEEAKEMLMVNLEREYKDELVIHYQKIENDIKEDSKKKGKAEVKKKGAVK